MIQVEEDIDRAISLYSEADKEPALYLPYLKSAIAIMEKVNENFANSRQFLDREPFNYKLFHDDILEILEMSKAQYRESNYKRGVTTDSRYITGDQFASESKKSKRKFIQISYVVSRLRDMSRSMDILNGAAHPGPSKLSHLRYLDFNAGKGYSK